MMLCATLLGLLFSLVLAQKDNGNECDCFRTNGSSTGYFTNHQFYDFRNVSDALTQAPDVLTSPESTTDAPTSSSFLVSNAFTADWTIQSWNNTDTLGQAGSDASILMINSPNNVYIEKSNDSSSCSFSSSSSSSSSSSCYNSYLTLRTTRQPTFQSASEIDSTAQNFHHLSARFLARVVGAPGACAGLFTYLAGNTPSTVQEADIEILTSGPRNLVQYTNQPSNDAAGNTVVAATANVSEPAGRDWTQWMEYRVDWMPKRTTWFVDGTQVADIAFQVPRDPAGLIVNMWGDGGSWTGNMTNYDQAFLQIQWIQVVYNMSGDAAGNSKRDQIGSGGLLEKRGKTPGCKAVCGIDEEVNVTGTPAFLYNSTAPVRWKGEGKGSMAWIPLVLIGCAMFGYF